MLGQTDPFILICEALQAQLTAAFPQIKNVGQAWPDPKWFGDTGQNLPAVFLTPVSEAGNAKRSRYQPFTTDAQNIYFETSRQQVHVQITLVTSTPDERTSLGHAIKQYLINLRRLPLSDGQQSLIRFRDDTILPGSDNFYERHLTFQFQTRIFSALPGTPATQIRARTQVE